MSCFDGNRMFLLIAISYLFLATIGNKMLLYILLMDTQLKSDDRGIAKLATE